ncbi:MAG: molybdenum cofactor guanylyltransferase [Ardenticatenales bacterium]
MSHEPPPPASATSTPTPTPMPMPPPSHTPLPAPRGRRVGPAAASPAAAPSPRTRTLRLGDEAVTGIVLAGGRSRRMGMDKAFIELAGRPLIAWVLDALAAVAERCVIVTHDEDARFERFGVPVVVDHVPARGPLSGLHAGLTAAPTDLCLAVACDLPLVQSSLLALLADAAADVLAAVPDAGASPLPDGGTTADVGAGGLQPLLAAYRRGCIPAIERLLANGSAPASMVASTVPSVIVGPDRWRAADPDGRSFHNVNTLSDLATAAQWMNRLAP